MMTVSGVLVMVVDRGKVRQITLGPRRKNPWFVRHLAHGIAVLFEGERLCAKKNYGGMKSHEGMKELIHYSVCELFSVSFSSHLSLSLSLYLSISVSLPPLRATPSLITFGQLSSTSLLSLFD
jgi:hypothetical protein